MPERFKVSKFFLHRKWSDVCNLLMPNFVLVRVEVHAEPVRQRSAPCQKR